MPHIHNYNALIQKYTKVRNTYITIQTIQHYRTWYNIIEHIPSIEQYTALYDSYKFVEQCTKIYSIYNTDKFWEYIQHYETSTKLYKCTSLGTQRLLRSGGLCGWICTYTIVYRNVYTYVYVCMFIHICILFVWFHDYHCFTLFYMFYLLLLFLFVFVCVLYILLESNFICFSCCFCEYVYYDYCALNFVIVSWYTLWLISVHSLFSFSFSFFVCVGHGVFLWLRDFHVYVLRVFICCCLQNRFTLVLRCHISMLCILCILLYVSMYIHTHFVFLKFVYVFSVSWSDMV